MLLFSKILDIRDTFTEEKFIKLVIEWNQSHMESHPENCIPNVQWNGEPNVHYGNDGLWMEIKTYEKERIVAVRYEKTDEFGRLWDTDYVMHFNEMRMAVRLERSYKENALTTDSSFSSPFFIKTLIKNGCLKDDGDLSIDYHPIWINDGNLTSLTDIINGLVEYQLPIVYISKTADGKDPVDVTKIAHGLKGIAHVFAEENAEVNAELRSRCGKGSTPKGAINIYFPQDAYESERYTCAETNADSLYSKVIASISRYNNRQKMDELFTWQGVNNAMLLDNVKTVEEERDGYVEMADADLEKMKEQIVGLNRDNEKFRRQIDKLERKNQRLNGNNESILCMGKEKDYYPDEIKAIVLDVLEKALQQQSNGTRRYYILKDIMESNQCVHKAEEWKEKLKAFLTGYKHLDDSIKSKLQDMGFEITGDGKHYKLVFHEDERCSCTMSKTPSDSRVGLNTVSQIVNTFF